MGPKFSTPALVSIGPDSARIGPDSDLVRIGPDGVGRLSDTTQHMKHIIEGVGHSRWQGKC